ncbi:MAG TPA: nickel insertion protein [Anaerolineaceae bacterium]|nr:nickel insertion protein [Anaerolineaceae bacterium]
MRLLYLDCRLGFSTQTLFAGLLELGLPPAVMHPLPPVGGRPAADWIAAGRGDSLANGAAEACTTIRHADALAWLESCPLPDDLRAAAGQILDRLAGCSGSAGLTAGELASLAGVLLGLEELGIEQLYSSPLAVSLPAVSAELLQVLQDGRVPLSAPAVPACPTLLGAALLAQRAVFVQPDMRILATAQVRLDGGEQTALRLVLGEPVHPHHGHDLCLLQTNLDDISPQQVGYVVEKLNALGAVETYQIPISMKKNRLGIQLNVVGRVRDKTRLVEAILSETPTLGVRISTIDDHVMAAYEIQPVETAYGPVPVKLKLLGGQVIGAQPEIDACARIAADQNLPLQQIFVAAQAAAHERIQGRSKA